MCQTLSQPPARRPSAGSRSRSRATPKEKATSMSCARLHQLPRRHRTRPKKKPSANLAIQPRPRRRSPQQHQLAHAEASACWQAPDSSSLVSSLLRHRRRRGIQQRGVAPVTRVCVRPSVRACVVCACVIVTIDKCMLTSSLSSRVCNPPANC